MRISFFKREQELLERIRSGDEKAMELVYSQNRKSFIGWCIENYSSTEEEAVDHYQDAITIFLEKVMNGSLTSIDSSIKTYVFGIGKNRIRQQFQKENTKARHLDEVAEHYQFLASNKELGDIFSSARDSMLRAFDDLGDQCKEILRLFYFEKRSMSEIAVEMGFKNEGVSRTTKKRCLEKVRAEVLTNTKEV